ncbi:MAG: hypothetical protein AAAB19_09195, partial [Rhizobium sp.]
PIGNHLPARNVQILQGIGHGQSYHMPDMLYGNPLGSGACHPSGYNIGPKIGIMRASKAG